MQPAAAVDTTTADTTIADTSNSSPDPVSSVKLFHAADSTFSYRLPHPDFPTGKRCTVRFPTDEEWCLRARSQSTTTRNIGRDAVKSETKGDIEADLAMFHSIRLMGDSKNVGVEFDGYEAGQIIQRLGRCQITDVRQEGNTYRITMEVAGNIEVVHVLKIPTQRQIMEYGRSAVQFTTRRTGQETKVLLEPSGDLWDKLTTGVLGYADSAKVPIIHKDIALNEHLAQIRASIEEGPDPED